MKKSLYLLLLATPLVAEECFSSCECCELPHAAYVQLRHREPGGIGYNKGYTSFDLFYTPDSYSNCHTFFDLRGHVFNDGRWATNLGIGLRYMAECTDLVTGFNAYWDWRQAKYRHFNQIGLGFELLWPCWDFVLNGYIPVGPKRASGSPEFAGFEGNFARIEKKYSLAMGGFDTALGAWLYKSSCFGLHASLGGYYFRGDFSQDFGGGIAKAKVSLWDWIFVEGQVSYDNRFKWVGQGELALRVPFGHSVARSERKISSCECYLRLEERLLEQPERFEILVIDRKKKTDVARNPVNGQPLTFFFVDNTSNSAGTIESPFPTIAQAEAASGPYDAIYVFPGSGDYTDPLTLKEGQLLGSSAAPFAVQSRFGILEIPSISSARPRITEAIQVANHNRITGMEIDVTGGAIEGTAVQDLLLAHNVLISTGAAVTVNTSFDGFFSARGNTITSTGAPAFAFTGPVTGRFEAVGNNVTDASIALSLASSFDGNFLVGRNQFTTTSTSIDVTGAFSGSGRINRNTLTDAVLFSNSYEGLLQANHNQITSPTTGLTIAGEVSGIVELHRNTILSDGGSAFCMEDVFAGRGDFQRNVFGAGASAGFDFDEDVQADLLFRDNEFFTTGSNGISFGPSIEGDLRFDFNTMTAPNAGIFIPGDHTGQLTLKRNTLTAEFGNGYFLTGDTRGDHAFLFNSIASPDDEGIFHVPGEHVGNLLFLGNQIEAQQEGIEYRDISGSISFIRNRIASSQDRAVDVAGTTSGVLVIRENEMTSFDETIIFTSLTGNAFIQHNTLLSATDDSFSLNDLIGTVIFEHNQITSNQDNGITLTDSEGQLLIRNNTLQSFGGGVTDTPFLLNTNEPIDVIASNNLLITRNANDGGWAHVQTGEVGRERFLKNTHQTETGTGVAGFFTFGGDILIESPNSDESGVNAINVGDISPSGAVFVPYD